MGKKIKPHVNGNEYDDSCRFNPRSQIYSLHICQLIRFSLLFGKNKNKAHEISFALDEACRYIIMEQPYFEVCMIGFDERK